MSESYLERVTPCEAHGLTFNHWECPDPRVRVEPDYEAAAKRIVDLFGGDYTFIEAVGYATEVVDAALGDTE